MCFYEVMRARGGCEAKSVVDISSRKMCECENLVVEELLEVSL